MTKIFNKTFTTIKLVIIFIFLISNNSYSKNDVVIKKFINNPIIVGSSDFSYLLWEVYNATLYANSEKWSGYDKIFALKLKYKRKLYGDEIAKRSIKEMRQLGFKDEQKLAEWYSQMSKIFPDVKKDTELTGIYIPGKETIFFKDNIKIDVIKDNDFGKWFFDIWLSPETSEPKLREKLLNLNDHK